MELLDRGARLVFESGRPIAHVAADLGLPAETLRKHVRQVEVDEGRREGLDAARSARRSGSCASENFELRRANEILKAASVFFAKRARHRPTEVSRFIDEHRGRFGVEPICRTLGVSASAYYQRATGERSAREVEDERLLERDPRAARGELLRLRLPADVEGAAARRRERCRAAGCSG